MPKNPPAKKRRGRKRNGGGVIADSGIPRSVTVKAVGGADVVFTRKFQLGSAQLYTTTAGGTTGATSTPANGVVTLAMSLFSVSMTLFQAVDEIQIHEWVFEIRPVSNNPGTSLFAVDWNSVTNSSAPLLLEKSALILSNSNTSANAGVVAFRAVPPQSAPYNNWFDPTGSLPYTAALNWYTDNGTYGTTAAATNLFTVIYGVVASGRGRG